MNPPPAGRDPGLDLVRAVAITLVVLLHAFMGPLPAFGLAWNLNLGVYTASKICVPLFLMVTGALFLNRPAGPVGPFYLRRFRRLGGALLFGTILAVLWRGGVHSEHFSGRQVIAWLLGEPAYFHLWFLWLILALTPSLPWLGALVRAMDTDAWRAFLASYAVLLVWPAFSHLLAGVDIPAAFFGIGGYAGLLVLGAGLATLPPSPLALRLAVLGLVCGLGSSATATLFLSQEPAIRDERMLQFLRPPLVVSSASAFFLLLQLGRSTLTALPRLHAAVQRLASCALAVYLLHAYPLEFVRYKVQGTGAASLAGQTLTFLITLAVSWILAEALCRVPVLRRTLA